MYIDKREKNYIELEMSRYEQYKKDIELERKRILDSSPPPPDGLPRGNAISNSTADKAGKLVDSISILAMERSIRAVDKTLNSLTPIHRKIFNLYFICGRRDYYAMCDLLHISIDSFRRYKKTMVVSVGKELGVIKNI